MIRIPACRPDSLLETFLAGRRCFSTTSTLLAADIVVKRVVDALDLLLKPLRLVATLRH